MPSLFSCPICAAPLARGERAYTCPNRHSFDVAREGYVHLLPANRKHAKEPGDDREMSAARGRFLAGGWYAPLRSALGVLALAHTARLERPAVLDAGCGEGYYDAGLLEALSGAGRAPELAGVDLSKPSVKQAARRCPAGEFAVATVYHLPMGAERVDLLLNCFSPLALDEFRRVLRPGGVFLYVTPAANHLWELKEVLYDRPYLNREEAIPYEGFEYLDIVPVEGTMDLDGGAAMDLFRMTPYAWKTPKEGVERLAGLDRLKVGFAFRIHVFRRG